MTNSEAVTALQTIKSDLQSVTNPKIAGLRADSDKIVENVEYEIAQLPENYDPEAEWIQAGGSTEHYQGLASALDARILPA